MFNFMLGWLVEGVQANSNIYINNKRKLPSFIESLIHPFQGTRSFSTWEDVKRLRFHALC
jgi:hypothetical protein